MKMLDFFSCPEELDEFLLGLPLFTVLRITGNFLRVFRCDYVDMAGKARGARLVQNIRPYSNLILKVEHLPMQLDLKKKHRRH